MKHGPGGRGLLHSRERISGGYLLIILSSTPNVTAATTKPEHGKARPAKGSKMERGQSV
jgi:hypothetical protein